MHQVRRSLESFHTGFRRLTVQLPVCTCRHKKGCPIASVPATPHPSPASQSPWKPGKYLRQPSSLTRLSGSGAFPKTPSTPTLLSTPSTPLPSPSAYDLGYDLSMSLSRVAPAITANVATRTQLITARAEPISVITPLPQRVTGVFSGRVGKKKPRLKNIKMYVECYHWR